MTPSSGLPGWIVWFEARASAVPADQRVTFFAGAKKVTKETPFQSEPPLRMRSGNLRGCEDLQVIASSRGCMRRASNAQKLRRGSGVGRANFFDLHALSMKAGASAVPADQRVTFFAGAKKVTKETPFQSEPPLRKRRRNLRASDGFQAITWLRRGVRRASNTQMLEHCSVLTRRHAPSFAVLLASEKNLRGDVVTWNPSTFHSFPRRFLSGGSDSKRCFFGDFLCTSKESYPLVRRTSGSSCSVCTSKESYPLAAGQRKLWLRLRQEKNMERRRR